MRLHSQLSAESPALDSPPITLPAASVNPCEALGSYLQHRWNAEVGESSIRLRCAPRGQKLLVLIEHVIAEQPPVDETFRRVEALLEEAPESLWESWLGEGELPEQVSLLLFLRVLDQPRPYLEHQHDINLLSGVAPGMLPLLDPEAAAAQAAANGSLPIAPNGEVSALALRRSAAQGEVGDEAAEPEPVAPGPARLDSALDPEVAEAFLPEHLLLEPFPPEDGVEGGYRGKAGPADREEAPDPVAFPAREEPLAREPFHVPKSVWAAGLCLCLATFVGSFYIASRPCYARSCPPLTLAQQQAQEAKALLQVANSWQDIERSRTQLQSALQQLRNVPGWSSYGVEAKGLRSRYRQLLEAMTPVQEALQQASEAEQKTEFGQIQTRQWQDVQAHWEAAIAQLRSVPAQSPLYALAQDKLKQYETTLAGVQANLLREQEGQRLLEEARDYAAETVAVVDDQLEALEVLQQAEARLADAIFTLKKVPRGTQAHQEAMRLMTRYQSELSINRGQQSQEAFIVDSYQEALAYAEDAKRFEGQGRWNDARDHWQTALNRIDQIPSKSPYFNKAQALVSEYTYALRVAEQQAAQQDALARVAAELDVICAGSPQVCTYEVSTSRISVQLTLDYERAVLTAGVIGDEQSRFGALQHVQELESALEAASNTAQIPLELYDPDGVMVGSHQPRRGLGTI